MLSLFRNYFSDKKHDFCLSIYGDYHTYKVEVLHYRHAIRNDVITMYDIIKFHTDNIKDRKYLKHNNTIQKVVRLYFRYLSLNHPMNNLSVKLDDVIHGSYIIMFGVAVMENFNLISVVITTNRKTEIMFFIRKKNPK